MKISIMISILLFGQPNMFMSKNKWIKNKKENIILYTRPINYSNSKSPTKQIIDSMLNEIDFVRTEINKKLETNYKKKIKVFLYNYDEAENFIGTNTGGFNSFNGVYYTYIANNKYYDINRKKEFIIGFHEFVHIVTWYELKKTLKNRLFIEGYAVAIDGYYAGESIFTTATKYELIPPSELIKEENKHNRYPEFIFYPQAGLFINWLFDKYGVEKINKLYKMKDNNKKETFEEVLNEKFSNIERYYIDYFKKLKERNKGV